MSMIYVLGCARAGQIINTAISYAPESQNIFADITGKSLQLTSHLPSMSVIISCTASEISIQPAPATEPENTQFDTSDCDARLIGSPPALIMLALETRAIDEAGLEDTEAPDIYDGPVQISGDSHFVTTLRSLLQQLEVDWEAWLASLVGDIPAHLAATSVRKAKHWQAQTQIRTADALENYFRNEWSSAPWHKSASQFTEKLVALGSDREQVRQGLNSLKSRFLQIIG